MNRKNIIGIPIKNLEEPMSRLSSILDKNQRTTLQIGLIKNLAAPTGFEPAFLP